MAIKNGQSIETDNCITTIIYILSFTVTIFMYQAQLINTEILSDKIKRNNKYNWTHIYVFSGRRNQYTNTNAVPILTVTIPHWRFMIFNSDMSCTASTLLWNASHTIMYYDTTFVLEHSFKYRKSIYYSLVSPSKSCCLYIDFAICKWSWICIACSFYFLLFVAVQ